MRYLLLLLPSFLNAQTIQLAPPQFVAGQLFFKGKTQVKIDFDLEGAAIRYGLQANPDVLSPIYSKPIKICTSTTIKAMSTHPDYLPSAVVEKQFIKVKYRPKSMTLQQQPDKSYPGNGAGSLHDFIKGSTNLRDGNWLGFKEDSVTMEVLFGDRKTLNNLIISTLSDFNSWVMAPRSVTVYGKNNRNEWLQLGVWEKEEGEELVVNPCFISIKLLPVKTKEIKVVVLPFGLLPEGHPGVGIPAWLFLDEVLFQ